MSKHRTVHSWLPAALIAAVVALAPVRASAEERIGMEAGLGAASAVSSLIYGPVKLCYATGGALIAGLGWLFSAGDQQVVSPILTAALRGDYVVTPEHLTRHRSLEFIGRDPTDRQLRHAANY
jgi:hypothetical protein